MYTLKLYSKTIRLRNKELKELKDRFNPDKFVLFDSAKWETHIRDAECPLCTKYRRLIPSGGCTVCPLDQYSDGTRVGCSVLLQRIVGSRNLGFCPNPMAISIETKRGWGNMRKVFRMLNKFKKEV